MVTAVFACLFLVTLALCNASYRKLDKKLDALSGLRPPNAHANMLGQVVEARKYEASDWEAYVVCAVSWHGSLCLRSIDAPDRRGFWVHHDKVADRVREAG